MRQSTALHATRRNQVSAVFRQAKHYCVDRGADLQAVVADPPRLPGWERVVGDGRHLPEERPAVLDQPVSNPLAFSGSPHATLRFPKLPRRGCETTAGSTEGWSNHLAFRIAGELWRRRDERTPFGPSRRDSNPRLSRAAFSSKFSALCAMFSTRETRHAFKLAAALVAIPGS